MYLIVFADKESKFIQIFKIKYNNSNVYQDYSFTDCVFSYVYQTAGCQLDWFSKPAGNIPVCTNLKEIRKLYDIDMMYTFNKWTYRTISRASGTIEKFQGIYNT